MITDQPLPRDEFTALINAVRYASATPDAAAHRAAYRALLQLTPAASSPLGR